jgi:hypothetical protein
MQQALTPDAIKSYYEDLQSKLPDTRQSKGKRHELALVLTTMLLAVLRSVGKLNISVIHRQMRREHEYVLSSLGKKHCKLVSDPQFRRILSQVAQRVYNQINASHFGVNLREQQGHWQAIDGKELRGNIDGLSGQKRVENVVRMVSNIDKDSQIIGFYHGDKESEKTVVSQCFERQIQLKGAYSFDVLHTSVALLEAIAQKSGVYLAQVKANRSGAPSEAIAQRVPASNAAFKPY